MKIMITILLFLTLGLQPLIAQESIGFTDPDEVHHLLDYRLPSWGFERLFLDFNGSYNSTNHFDDRKDQVTTGRLAPSYHYYRESEDIIIDGRVTLPLNLTNRTGTNFAEVETVTRDVDVLLTAIGDGKYYLDEQLFATGQADIRINTFRTTTDIDGQRDRLNKTGDFNIMLSAGAGYGRVRNVTPVIRALRFNERLNALNSGSLDRDQIQNLAAVFAQRGGYTRIFDRPNKHFWDAISGVAPNQLGSMSLYDAFYLSETLTEAAGQRFEGWDATAQLFVDYQKFTEERQVGDSTTEFDDSQTRLGLNLAGRYYQNLSLTQMISVRANLGIGFDLSDDDDTDQLLLGGIELGHLYNITDRILVQSALSINFEQISGDDDSISRSLLLLNSDVNYFVEDNMNLFVTFSYRKDGESFGENDRSRTNFGINAGIRYYFITSLIR